MMYGKKYLEIVIQRCVWDVEIFLQLNILQNIYGVATVETNAIRKEAGFDGNFTYGMENVGSNKRYLMNPDELLKMDHNKAIVMVRGRKPFICYKYDYMEHPEASKLEDMTVLEQKEKFKDNFGKGNIQVNKKTKKYLFKDF